MSSWTLLRHLFLFRQQYHHNPVFRREMRRQFHFFRATLPELGSLALISLSVLLLLLAFLLGMPPSFGMYMPICIPLGLCFLAYPLVVLIAALSLAPLIVRERVQHTWETLRGTPLPVETIVLGKAHATISKLYDQTIRLLIGFTLGTGSLLTAGVLLLQHSGASLSDNSTNVNCGLTLLLLASGILFFAERAQQAALFSAAALAVSASARSTRSGLAGTLASTVLLWTADLMIVELLVRALPRHGETLPVAVLWFGSTVAYGMLNSLSQMYLCIALTFAVREIAVRVLWWWAVRAARGV
jgi:hypothetical protein